LSISSPSTQSADTLVVDAKVSPRDVDQVAVGAQARVRIMAGNQRTTPDLAATVMLVSADLTRDTPANGQASAPYYLVRLELTPDEIQKLGNLKLIPGMYAEAFIRTYPRTPLQYLLKPLNEQIARTFRER
jgi:HlyD family secretion protein